MKVNLIFSTFYLLIVVPILSSITIFENEFWKYFQIIFPGSYCGLEILGVYIFVIPLISAIFSIILSRMKKFIFVPIFMSMLVFLFIIIGELSYNMCQNRNLVEGLDICYIFYYFKISLPTFIGSLLGILIGKIILAIYYNWKK